ncbi:hypothetical protein QQZ08_000673 [Neonectria magnoliae]|uniref:Molybdopterin synthase catalytic subunit n=1 Tax=Neonectria magnoliae TaxID=2732573 RepID=A0ABR1IGP1_9HYPO
MATSVWIQGLRPEENLKEAEAKWETTAEGCYIALTNDHLNVQNTMDKVRDPGAGAIVIFAGKPPPPPLFFTPLTTGATGTTRDSFDGKPVKELQYTSYHPRALRSMLAIAQALRTKHGLKGIAMVHRLGTVPIGEESILIAVSAPHRQAAWRAGEEALEECKASVEVWKREEFEGEEGVWRANRDGAVGQREEV